MFKRRNARSILQNIRELFWPSMGWIRAFHYTKLRLVRLSDSTHRIALGLSIGSAISFTPIVGTHFIQAGFIAYLVRANFISALIGTFAGNPWTFPFMWWAAISFGSFLFQLVGLPASTSLPDHVSFSIIWDIIKNDPFRIFLPWLVGGYLLGFLSMPFTYFVFYYLVGGAKLARKKARERKLHIEAKDMTGQSR
ncbi:MAG: DUF2062 domain-containing protein [Alphaproteobacteria bacterium]|nr:DUF2062 domain-containing protein [Alphaproteobacteria bacterium]